MKIKEEKAKFEDKLCKGMKRIFNDCWIRSYNILNLISN